MKLSLAIIAMGITAVAVPASAKTSAAAQNPVSGGAAAATTKYCITYEKTLGSLLNREECKTKQQWAKDQVDVDKLMLAK